MCGLNKGENREKIQLTDAVAYASNAGSGIIFMHARTPM
jgi:hypothetical protein